jgi:hypothetical protein
MKVLPISLFLLWVVPVHALPDSPLPKINLAVRTVQPEPRFWDRPMKVEFTSMVAMGSFDMAQTCNFLQHGRSERLLTQSCPGNVALTAGFDAAALTGAWLLHKTGHRKLARLPMLYMAGVSTYGVAKSKSLGAW